MTSTVLILLASSVATGTSLRTASEVSVEIHSHPRSYKDECGTKVRVAPSLAPLALAIGSYAEVLNNGFSPVECVRDYFLEHAGEFGSGDGANVSIVRYLEHTPKEHQEPMTPEVCFKFCRSVPLMSFFGLANGRDCYCEPRYEAMAGDRSECDAACEGDAAAMCGGVRKSSIFQMHACGNTAKEAEELAGAMTDLSRSLDATAEEAEQVAQELQEAATNVQAKFRRAGDPVVSDLMQGAAGTARELRAAVKAAKAEVEVLSELREKAVQLAGAGSVQPEQVPEADAILEDGKTAMDAAGEAGGSLDSLVKKVKGPEGGSLEPYVPITYFVDKDFESAPSTCGGTPLGDPLVGTTPEACAGACNDQERECGGFSYFAGEVPVCILLARITSTTYYTGCEGSELQSSDSQPTPPVPKIDGPTPPAQKGDGPTPPAQKGGGPTPPAQKGGGPTPPAEKGGGGPTPPAKKGGGPTPPAEKGGGPTPPAKKGGGPTPPAKKGGGPTPPAQKGSGPTPPAEKGGGPTPPAKKGGGPTPPAVKMHRLAPVARHEEASHTGTKCYAKVQRFEGVSLKPDPRGECELCLKSVTNAKRCF